MWRAISFLAWSLLVVGCKGPMAKIEAERDALASGDKEALAAATTGYPTCKDVPFGQDEACLSDIANAFGSAKGFVGTPPDHASAATAALLLVRDGRGDMLTQVDGWLADLKTGKGPGHDALRLAVARKMAEAAPIVGKKLDDDASARAALRAVVGAVPGACRTYWLVATNVDPATIPPELLPDHSACVQKDLRRREGPGGTYGAGVTRALEGGLSVWRETERALRLGIGNADGNTKATIEAKLSIIEPATLKIETVRVATVNETTVLNAMGEAHAEAGVRIFRKTDASASP